MNKPTIEKTKITSDDIIQMSIDIISYTGKTSVNPEIYKEMNIDEKIPINRKDNFKITCFCVILCPTWYETTERRIANIVKRNSKIKIIPVLFNKIKNVHKITKVRKYKQTFFYTYLTVLFFLWKTHFVSFAAAAENQSRPSVKAKTSYTE